MNVYNLTLNLDKTQRIVNPYVVHRVGDKNGTTIKVNILGGTIYGAILHMCFDNGIEISIPDNSSGSSITITLNLDFEENLGRANCYIRGDNGVTTQSFIILCIEDIHYTDDDLTWGNSNFQGKIRGDLTNSNMIVRTKVDFDIADTIINGNKDKNFKYLIKSNIFNTHSTEISQSGYDSLVNGFSDSISEAGLAGNYLSGDSDLDINQSVANSYVSIPGYNRLRETRQLYLPFARLKVPINSRKLKIKNILTPKSMIQFGNPGNHLQEFVTNHHDIQPLIAVYSDSTNAEFIVLKNRSRDIYYNGHLEFRDSNRAIKDIDGIEATKVSDDGYYIASEIEIDCLKCNVIDKDGYINIAEQGAMINAYSQAMYRVIYYPQINVDYGYLDLS